jgi:hypothetical protein
VNIYSLLVHISLFPNDNGREYLGVACCLQVTANCQLETTSVCLFRISWQISWTELERRANVLVWRAVACVSILSYWSGCVYTACLCREQSAKCSAARDLVTVCKPYGASVLLQVQRNGCDDSCNWLTKTRPVNKQAVWVRFDGDELDICFILLYQLLNVVAGNSSRIDVYEMWLDSAGKFNSFFWVRILQKQQRIDYVCYVLLQMTQTQLHSDTSTSLH